MDNTIKIFDTTLRDGEQSPGCSMNLKEKLEIALQLEKLGVDIIEAGFAISSKGDFASIDTISEHIKQSRVCSLCRAVKPDIDAAAESIRKAKHQRIHTFIATSPIHMKYKLNMTPSQVLEHAVGAVTYAKQYVEDIEFSCEDAGRSDPKFLIDVYNAVIKAGATVINVPDTVGYKTPTEFGDLIKTIYEHLETPEKVDISVHCHDDLGFATANSIAGILNGARQVETTINGIGERAGNTAMEEVVMALHVRQDFYNFSTNIRTEEIYKTSRLVSHITGSVVQPNKAIVGANAFAHEAGIHQDGVLKKTETYEIMSPEVIGLKTNNLVLGKHSGRHALSTRLKELGYTLNETDFIEIFEKFKHLADKKKDILDEDLHSIINDKLYVAKEIYALDFFNVLSTNSTQPEATVSLVHNDKKYRCF